MLARLLTSDKAESLGSLETLLERDVEKQPKQDLDVFGAKIPSEMVGLLGLPLLIVLLFQLSAIAFYTARKFKRMDEAEVSAWSFLLPGFPFTLLCLGSICGLPVTAAILTLIFQPGGNQISIISHWTLTVITVACGIAAFAVMLILRRCVTSAPQVSIGRDRLPIDDPPA